MACWEGKKYKLRCSDNYDEYLKDLGTGLMVRKVLSNSYPTIELKRDDEIYTLTTTTTIKTINSSFKLGETMDEVALDGRRVQSTYSMEGDTLSVEQRGDYFSTVVYTFSDYQLDCVLSSPNVKCTQIYDVV